MKIWDAESGDLWRTWITKCSVTGLTLTVAISDNGRTVVTGDQDGIVHIWNGTTGELLHTLSKHRRGGGGCGDSGWHDGCVGI